jgi:hypothetical protein
LNNSVLGATGSAIDSEAANDPHSTANTAVPAGLAGLPSAERFIGNLEINIAAKLGEMQH